MTEDAKMPSAMGLSDVYDRLPKHLQARVLKIASSPVSVSQSDLFLAESQENDRSILADYYLILSETEGLAKEIRDFCLDAMLYFEQKDEGFYSNFDIKGEFDNKILPLLDSRENK
ncbi:MAG TPA: hypothetical protein VGE62_03030 [Candidatus Paceibacterota bacterium]